VSFLIFERCGDDQIATFGPMAELRESFDISRPIASHPITPRADVRK
jgi:hypothetical protein